MARFPPAPGVQLPKANLECSFREFQLEKSAEDDGRPGFSERLQEAAATGVMGLRAYQGVDDEASVKEDHVGR